MLEFTITSGKIHITDPCYDTKTICGLYNIKAKKGTWIAEIEEDEFDGRIAVLKAYHRDYSLEDINDVIGENIGVDSGQAGIFDSSYYPEGDNNGKADDSTTFYGRACRETCDSFDQAHQEWKREQGLPRDWGIVDGHGVVSSSGYGDGCYKAYGVKNEGELVAIKIVFIGVDGWDKE